MSARPPYRELGRLVDNIGNDGFAAAVFELMYAAVGADHVVAHLVGRHHILGLFTHGLLSARIANTINQRYLERYHMLDKSVSSFRELGDDEPVVTRFDQRLNASPTYSAFFFERTGLCDKLSVVSNRSEGMAFCNLYRLDASGKFSKKNLLDAQALAPVLMAAIWQHVDRIGQASLPTMKTLSEPYAAERHALRTLSRREMQVCQRLLAGASNEGVALDLSISTHTVRTLRKRVYKKLQVNSLSDLYAKYMNAMSAVVSGQ
ncbi:MAG TPA: helix-turn-helix transcriptional regulator [Eoetvoesiella sp.]|jgi:DNA-binding CsgD family transcriptional regulator|uniref:helix-turn-helix transcriptional regulator n=1 Tax=Eoetvoesiella sp. TaxID=1966355 RepID=UPI002C2967AF|nr:helix-turn-helix transcriptional regulator [Eoetvoesiella sp.]HWK62041.1 helix-turn-helix transcriptional regulator [Eoetvoesiella sp.]